MFSDLFDFTFGSFAGGILISIILFLFLLLCLVFVSNVLKIVAKWKLLKQAGKGGWEALVPIYNNIVFCDIIGINSWWVLIVIISPILCSIPIFGFVLSQFIIIYFNIIYNVSIAKSYGKEEAFGIGLWLLPPVFWLILAFGNSSYIGKKGNDPVMNYINKKINNDVNDSVIYCSSCGYRNSSDANFCKNCGNKINR